MTSGLTLSPKKASEKRKKRTERQTSMNRKPHEKGTRTTNRLERCVFVAGCSVLIGVPINGKTNLVELTGANPSNLPQSGGSSAANLCRYSDPKELKIREGSKLEEKGSRGTIIFPNPTFLPTRRRNALTKRLHSVMNGLLGVVCALVPCLQRNSRQQAGGKTMLRHNGKAGADAGPREIELVDIRTFLKEDEEFGNWRRNTVEFYVPSQEVQDINRTSFGLAYWSGLSEERAVIVTAIAYPLT